jgi:hypothetical protein
MALSPPCPRAWPLWKGPVLETIFSARLTDRPGRVVIPLAIRPALQPFRGLPGVLKAAGRNEHT